MSNLGEEILNHYESFLGNYMGVDTYSNGEHEIQLLGFDHAIENCLLFATFGFSKYSNNVNSSCEVIMAVDDDYDSCSEVFINSIFYLLSNKMEFGRGVLIEGTDSIIKDFSNRHGKVALYFTEVYALPEEFSMVNDECKMYMGFFVSKNEADYIKKYGYERFEDLLEQNECDVIELNRQSVV